MQRVLIVSETQSYLLTALAQKLEEAECEVLSVHANPDAVSKISEEIDLMFLFADEALLEQSQGLTYLKDKAVEEDIAIYVSGDVEEIETITENIPSYLLQKKFPRPINVNEVAEAIDSYMKTNAKQNKRKILVVDDSGAMLRNVKGWLEDKYQVILANSGAMAIKYLATSRPDLVLLDYEMPVIDGKQVLEMIRTETEFSDIPVIFLTSKGDRESVLKVMELKPEGYLLKTMPPEQIKKAVDDFFAKQKAMNSQ